MRQCHSLWPSYGCNGLLCKAQYNTSRPWGHGRYGTVMSRSPNPAVFGPHINSAPPSPSPKCLYNSSQSLSRVFNTLFLVYMVIQSYEVWHSVTTVFSQGGFSHVKVDILMMALPIVIGIVELAYITFIRSCECFFDPAQEALS